MATCDLGYEHEDAVAEPEAVVIEADPGPNENDVKIAEIEAEARVETERIYAEEHDQDLAGEVERLRGEVDGMRTVLATLAPPEPAEPEPVVVPVPEPEPVTEEAAAAPPETDEAKPRKAPAKHGFFS
jgi:hypothetical protein